MEVLGSIVGWESEGVATSISGWVLVVDSGGSVERLMDISNIVEEESHGGGELDILGLAFVSVGLDLLVLVGGLVVTIVVEPVDNGRHGLGGVVVLHLEVEVADLGAWLIEVWSVDVMPVGLVRATHVLDVVSEDSALNEWIVLLVSSVSGIVLLKIL